MANPSISPARKAALIVLEQVLTRGETILESLSTLENQGSDPRDAALTREIIFGTCRWLGPLRSALKVHAPKLEKFPPPIQRILEMAAYQLLYLDRVPVYAVISEAVNQARWRKFPRLTGAVNAILRALAKSATQAPPAVSLSPIHQLVQTHSHPVWLVEQWLSIWDEADVETLCQYNNTRAELSLRLRVPYEQAAERLNQMRLAFTRDERFPNRITLLPDQSIDARFFEDSSWVVQDGAAMLVALAASAKPGQRVWDVCAAPGGKTFALADQMKGEGEIIASDKNPSRLQKVQDQIKRLGLAMVRPHVFDALKDRTPPGGGLFDLIVLDVPCSGWGTFRRHPDLRWRLQPEDSPRLATMALQMLENTANYLRPDGVLVYSTCTLSPEENEGVVRQFLAAHPEFSIEPLGPVIPAPFLSAVQKEGWLRVFPPQWNLDGAFAARMRKIR